MTNPITNIPIPAILEIKSGIIYNLQDIFDRHGFENILMLFDSFTMDQWEANIKDSLSTTKVDTVLMQPHAEVHDLIKQAFSIKMYDAIVAVGGGAVIDCGKYMAFSRQTPFISIPTSASNDGFASSNCSLMIEGKKTTVPAKVPYGIIADLDIIQNAPSPFILAGVGDLMSNITALYDWEFEDRQGVSRVNAFASMLSKKAVNSFVRTPMHDIQDPTFLKELVSSLTMGGVATIISGNSAPISGSEHLISHALDKYAEHPHMHGIQVGIATYIMANVQEHRADRMQKVFTRTGFFDHIKTLEVKKADFKMAIENSPEIKPHRYTYLHEKKYQRKALDFLDQDPILQEILR
ncbi:glycerol dehydrogenase [Halobacillus halophilus]|uniref:Probable glycerol dehydrogenase n=1 Tax=Halobacillus halophilus (strain ATCC 35676 / DSM 2266 / JCM 20832 / KCTC 3685 / LMG 17431 / NBRC 102448 / NCIMB 2269) TaxID=866895 RepID=I0JLJ3_HALH3|nr:iron-containing alcohol dehydrogenase family protein [Halobacillus halophilus]ASF39125.1 glycerol dehydrogenase [Halobacillus halophilus]CCG45013.1 probable glycerol dehydrogenase [Halobacillus halophilus DSM 2266]